MDQIKPEPGLNNEDKKQCVLSIVSRTDDEDHDKFEYSGKLIAPSETEVSAFKMHS
jgi:hypothetical protein